MGFMDEKLWAVLIEKTEKEDRNLPNDQQIGGEYLAGIKIICNFGKDRAITIRNTFPMFTLHDETHICNIMRLMYALLELHSEVLSRDETAMLILAACCHDIGMSYSDNDKSELLADLDRINQYLDDNHSEYVKAYAEGGNIPKMSDDMIQNYLRSIHHERIVDLLCNFDWPKVLEGKVDREDLIHVCQSHGKDISSLDELEQTPTIDLRFCAVLLRLADILDFDTSRAPKAIYDYSGFGNEENVNAIKSKEEWNKHMSSHGFDFEHILDRSYPYILSYSASSKSMQIEQIINSYLDWVDQELIVCGKKMKRFTGKWQSFILPGKIKRNIKSEGYVSGQYRLTMDQEQIMELLVGKDLYSDPSVFVRELIQNAIDAVRTRKQLDKSLSSDWKAQINIRTWMDDEGYHWFRVEDNGTGMTEDIIMNYLLKIGRSYYTSDTFQQAKLRCKANPDFMPISRFGIGILSCFMGDEQTNRVEISTKHFNENENYYPALRLSMHGMNGYYYLASKAKNHLPGPMKGITLKEKEQYLKQAGTIIAVRTNLYQTGKHRSFKEIIDRYVVYPPVAIHYDGIEGSFDYPTESEFMDDIHKIQPSDNIIMKGLLEFTIPEEQLRALYIERPEISFEECPKIHLKCISLDQYTKSPYLTGAVLTGVAVGNHPPITIRIGNKKHQVEVNVALDINDMRSELGLRIYLEFAEVFKDRMRLTEKRYGGDEYNYRKLYDFYNTDRYRTEIARAICHNDVYNLEWKVDMSERYEVSLLDLDNAIEEVEQKFQETSGVELPSKEDIAIFSKYQMLKKEWKFVLCKLSQFDWYEKYFKETRKKTGLYCVAAHNGILCGDANFFFDSNRGKENFETIVLLNDKYRPSADVAREGIRSLTLETASDFEVIRNRINDQGFNLSTNTAEFEESGYIYFPMVRFWNLFDERADLVKQLVVQTENGRCTSEELRINLNVVGKLKLLGSPKLSNQPNWPTKRNNLYALLCAAYLRRDFSLRLSFSSYSTQIYILPKDSDIQNDYKDFFPPTFFLIPLDMDCPYLTVARKYTRNACNANHRFSQFILKNSEKLRKQVPGIFKEILRVLAEEEGDGLIHNINDLIMLLRNLPGGLFSVPDDLFLTDKDLK